MRPIQFTGFLQSLGVLATSVLAASVLVHTPLVHAESAPVRLPAPEMATPLATSGLQLATFAGGCFWGVQGVFEHVNGVRRVVSGYAGGDKGRANYEEVSSGTTGHAESVQISFDPSKVSYGQLLHIFFSVAHDPTELNRQGPDTGTQYRSAIFTSDASQLKVAQAYVAQLDKAHAFPQKIVTRIEPLQAFFPAEASHQDFLARNPTHPYIVQYDLPKIDYLKRFFPQSWLEQPVLLAKAQAR